MRNHMRIRFDGIDYSTRHVWVLYDDGTRAHGVVYGHSESGYTTSVTGDRRFRRLRDAGKAVADHYANSREE